MRQHFVILIALASVIFPLASAAQEAPRSFVEEAHRALEPAPEPKARKRVSPAILAVIRSERRGDEFYNCTVYVDRRVKCSSDNETYWTTLYRE
jgi:cell division septation protein DedD